ncbi:hypothetical protein EIN_398820 [Entamoeba invadens IP1]|uniref:Rho-GAP domain-containing protein n=1 Tax=Entamoeba invadens IP1 TaxID=370355 RepID=A0A0A1UA61_ENTIV|nr:hypothetical protein EIN_398820 [Entamoeba invadens IP1]ELP91912.1 hypothetical protein EIN_398820 [Entamoeba invadens IP1]|eukprot:XP_004258683.1 hypothetical protein EIN_398820 [Entamoeba invadens IP1]
MNNITKYDYWTDPIDIQCLKGVVKNLETAPNVSFRCVETMYYNHHLGGVFKDFENVSDKLGEWSLNMLVLLWFHICRNEVTVTQNEQFLIWLSKHQISPILTEALEVSSTTVVEIDNLETFAKFCEALPNAEKSSLIVFFDEIPEQDIKSICNCRTLLLTSKVPTSQCLYATVGDTFWTSTDSLINKVGYFVNYILSAIEGKVITPMETESDSVEKPEIMWKEEAVIVKRADALGEFAATFTGTPKEINCVFNGKVYQMPIQSPLHLTVEIPKINKSLVGEYLLSFLGGDSIHIQIVPGDMKTHNASFSPTIHAGSVQTIVLKCFDFLKNITSIGEVSMELLYNTQRMILAVENSLEGYISCTPVLYSTGEYEIEILNKKTILDKVVFTVLPEKVDWSKTKMFDEKGNEDLDVIIAEIDVPSKHTIALFDRFNNPVEEKFEVKVTGGMTEEKNVVVTGSINPFEVSVELLFDNVRLYYTTKQVVGVPRRVTSDPSSTTTDFTILLEKSIPCGSLMCAVIPQKTFRIDEIQSHIFLNQKRISGVVVQNENECKIVAWCYQIGKGSLFVKIGEIEKTVTFDVTGATLEIVQHIFSKANSIEMGTVTTTIRDDGELLEEYRIQLILNHILFAGIDGQFSKSTSPRRRASPRVIPPHQSDVVILERAKAFAVPLISSMRYSVVENTIAFTGIYGVPVVSLRNGVPVLKVVEKIVITRASDQFITETKLILNNVEKFEHPIRAIPYIPLFGQPLKVVMVCHRPLDGLNVPYFLFTAIRFIENSSTEVEGIFRLSGDAEEMKKIRTRLENAEEVDWSRYSIHSITNIIKQFFRELIDGLVLQEDAKKLYKIVETENFEVTKLKKELNTIYPPTKDILDLFSHLTTKIVQKHQINMMNEKNLMICLTPSLKISPRILSNILFRHDQLFDRFPSSRNIR